jgi:hypothetical protein
MKHHARRSPRPVAPDSLPSTPALQADRAQRVNELLEQSGLDRPQIDAWWGFRLDENELLTRTELWERGEFDAVEQQAKARAASS